MALGKEDQKLLNQFAFERNISKNTKEIYKRAMKQYVEFNRKSFTDLLNEADIEEETIPK